MKDITIFTAGQAFRQRSPTPIYRNQVAESFPVISIFTWKDMPKFELFSSNDLLQSLGQDVTSLIPPSPRVKGWFLGACFVHGIKIYPKQQKAIYVIKKKRKKLKILGSYIQVYL